MMEKNIAVSQREKYAPSYFTELLWWLSTAEKELLADAVVDRNRYKIVGMCDQEYGDMIKANPKVLVNFYADWCAPCIKMKPYILKLQEEKKGEVNLVRLNADENKTMITKLKLDELPAMLLYENGELKWQHNGFISEEDLRKQL